MNQVILTNFKNGASYTRGLTSDEFFQKQIYDALKFNCENRTLPFFNENQKALPRELYTGKLINDDNLIALEQVSAQRGYESNLWIFGSDLETLSKQGYKIHFMDNVQPVLCRTKYHNPTHLESELYVAEHGTKNKEQFLYNVDALTDDSKKSVEKLINRCKQLDQSASEINYKIFTDNMKKSPSEKQKHIGKIVQGIQQNRYINEIDCASLVEAQYLHNVYNSIGGKAKYSPKESLCYSSLNKLFNSTNNNVFQELKVAENLTKKLYSASIYQKAMVSRDFNIETNKIQEEQTKKARNINKGFSYA